VRRALAVLAAVSLSSACAQEVPGVTPPSDRLHFPVSVLHVPGTTPDLDRLLVASADFDQRYNAGTVVALDVARLFELAEAGRPEAPVRELPIRSLVKVRPFSGEMASLLGADGVPRVYLTARGRNRLTMMRVVDGALDCSNPGVEVVAGLDCTSAHMIHTGSDDPFSVAAIPSASTQGVLAVGHLQPTLDASQRVVGTIALVDVATYERRLEQERSGVELTSPVVAVRVDGLTGVTGIVPLPDAPGDLGPTPRLAAVGRDVLRASPVTVDVLRLTESAGRFGLSPSDRLSLGSTLRTVAARGLARTADGRRAYVSVRFEETGDDSNAGVAVLEVDEAGVRLISVLELGQELGAPALLEVGARRTLYLPDIRSDEIWVVDVSTDAPLVLGKMGGRITTMGADGPVRRVLLDAPAGIAFVERGGRRFGFVANFANSTLAVLDVNDPDPRRHAVKLRLGVAQDVDGNEEESP
jgi:hypothetical protein